ncbi:MAG: tRNA preQ1(34) S-adenosylmethionine ribosyltransferase-isomerase QueA [Longimicrobiales bacterium]|nr:tRNA preQ1(34) S-adenosylmethionine ribosyltransferase-isomerase QueA [Longimicrobiales bacterium]
MNRNIAADGSRVSHYDYDLPSDRVARYPAALRDESRLLAVDPDASGVAGRGVPAGSGTPFRHLRFSDVVSLFRPGDLLVVNESKVLPARLLGVKPTGARAEVLLLRPAGDDPALWEALVRPGGKLKPGRRVLIGPDLEVEMVDSAPGGGRLVRLHTSLPMEEALERYGRMPLPPYLEREEEALDRERYQTVYARVPGSVAAPTAGLHFTQDLLERLDAAGVERTAVTLHVGIGTFRPVEVDDPAHHELHHEWYEVPLAAAEAVRACRARGGRVWAVGTTAVRTLEAAADETGEVRPGTGSTDLFIRPPYRFRVVRGLITNFHLPRSTLLMLVAALAGYDRTMAAYREAVAEGYRFYSYGDAMVVLPLDGDAHSRPVRDPA